MAIFFAREGADVTIVYLSEEEEDAQNTKKAIEKEGRECLCIPFDLMQTESIKTVVDKHLEKYQYVRETSSTNILILLTPAKIPSWTFLSTTPRSRSNAKIWLRLILTTLCVS